MPLGGGSLSADVDGAAVGAALATGTAVRQDFAAWQHGDALGGGGGAPGGTELYERASAALGVTSALLARLRLALGLAADPEREEQLREWLEAVDEEDAALDDVAATLEDTLGMGGDDDDDDDDEEEEEEEEDERGGQGMQDRDQARSERAVDTSGSDKPHTITVADAAAAEEEHDTVYPSAPLSEDVTTTTTSESAPVSVSTKHKAAPAGRAARHRSSLPPLAEVASVSSSTRNSPAPPSALRANATATTHQGQTLTVLPSPARNTIAAGAPVPMAARLLSPAAVSQVSSPLPTAPPAMQHGHAQTCVVCVEDHLAETDAELNVGAGETLVLVDDGNGTGWSCVENAHGQQGFVPTDFLEPLEDMPGTPMIVVDNYSPQRAAAMPRTAQPATNEAARPDAAELNRMMVDSTLNHRLDREQRTAGFCAATLAFIAAQREHALSHILTPSVNESGLAFQDLRLDQATGKLKPHEVAVTRTFKLLDAKHVPVFDGGALGEVEERIVNAALFDKQHFLGNVFSLRAAWNRKHADMWKWTTASDMPSAKDSDNICLIRTDSTSLDLCLVFELIVVLKTAKGRSHVSCGWARLPLFKTSGGPNSSKTHDLRLYQGSPVNPINLKANGGMLHVKLSNINQTAKILCDSLPRTIVCQLTSVPVLSLYRDVLADALLRQPDNPRIVRPLFHPTLKCMPLMFDDNHLTSIFRTVWNDSLKLLKKAQKKDDAFVRGWFQRTFVDKMWPLLFVGGVGKTPTLAPGTAPASLPEREHAKQTTCERYMRGDPADQLTQQYVAGRVGYMHLPLHSDEMQFDLLAANALRPTSGVL